MIDTAESNFPIGKKPHEMNLEELLAYYEHLTGAVKRKKQEQGEFPPGDSRGNASPLE